MHAILNSGPYSFCSVHSSCLRGGMSVSLQGHGGGKVMQPTYYSVGTLAAVPSFVGEENYLPRYCFTVDAKHCALTWSKEVNRPRLQRSEG